MKVNLFFFFFFLLSSFFFLFIFLFFFSFLLFFFYTLLLTECYSYQFYMDQFPNAIKRESFLSEIKEDRPISVPGIKKWQAIVTFVVGALIMAAKDHITSVIGVVSIIVIYIVLILWVLSDFRMILGERIWQSFGQKSRHQKNNSYTISNKNKKINSLGNEEHEEKTNNRLKNTCINYCPILHYDRNEGDQERLEDIEMLDSSRVAELVTAAATTDTVHHAITSIPPILTEVENEYLENVEKEALHTNRLWHHYNIPSILFFYCLMKEAHWHGVKKVTESKIFHGHSHRIIGAVSGAMKKIGIGRSGYSSYSTPQPRSLSKKLIKNPRKKRKSRYRSFFSKIFSSNEPNINPRPSFINSIYSDKR